ncbi:MAG TPA: ferrous iron transport protein A [Dehalococcoidia bacterium]|nr:ferrous iron transport protein A [Dehalococcoidia bacterium]
MSQKVQLTLVQMKAGQSGTIIAILGGRGLARRLEALGVRLGKRITKISSTLFRGPVTLRVDHTQVAVGFGMARRILVEIDTSS